MTTPYLYILAKYLPKFTWPRWVLNQTDLAKRCGCSPRKINEIVNGKRGVSPAFAIGLETVLGTSAAMWVRMQAEYDLWAARQEVA